jgi:hypothetical protein
MQAQRDVPGALVVVEGAPYLSAGSDAEAVGGRAGRPVTSSPPSVRPVAPPPVPATDPTWPRQPELALFRRGR